MLLGAAVRRFSCRWTRVTGLASTTVLLCTAAGFFGIATAATPYPPTVPPCALSWSSGSSVQPVLVGSGYDTNRSVTITLYPQARPLGSYATDADGAFRAPLDVPRSDSAWVTASSPHRSCSVAPPTGTSPGYPPTPPSAGTPSTGGTTPGAGAGPGSGGASTGAQYPPTGSTTSPGGGSAGSGTTPTGTTPGGGTAPGGTAPGGDEPGSNEPGSTAPGSTAPGRPTPSSNADTKRALGLPLAAIITIAALLLVAGGLAVLVLTRRAG